MVVNQPLARFKLAFIRFAFKVMYQRRTMVVGAGFGQAMPSMRSHYCSNLPADERGGHPGLLLEII